MFQVHRPYFFLAILLFLTEVLIARYAHDQFIRPFGGDFLVVILMYCALKAVWNVRIWKAALGVLLFSYTIEILQYFKIVEILGLQDYKLACIIIGTSFAWSDMLAYTLGIMLVVGLEKWRS